MIFNMEQHSYRPVHKQVFVYDGARVLSHTAGALYTAIWKKAADPLGVRNYIRVDTRSLGGPQRFLENPWAVFTESPEG